MKYSILPASMLIIALALQVFIISSDRSIGDEDAAAYALQGQRITEGKGMTSDVVGLHYKRYPSVEHPEDYWPPLQSWLIAISRTLFGATIFADKLPNVIAFALLIAAVFALSLRLFSGPVAVLAALMCLLNSEITLYATGCRSDLVYFLLIFCGVYFLSGAGPTNPSRIRNAALGGIVSGLAFLQRPIAFILPASFPLWLIISSLSSSRPISERFGVLRRIAFPCILFVALFAAVILPFNVRNFKIFGSPMPDLPSIWSAVILESSMNNPSERTKEFIDARISMWKETRHVYNNRTPVINLRSPVHRKAFIAKGLNELVITLVLFKRSLIIEFTFTLLTVLSFFLIQGRPRHFLSLFLLYLAFSIVVIPFYMHTEQRYFVFIIPFICVFSASMLFALERFFAGNAGCKVRGYRAAYWSLICVLLVFNFLFPCVQLYHKNFARISAPVPLRTMGEWIHEHTPGGAVVMSIAPYRIGYYSRRPVVMLPDTVPDVIREVCEHYGVSMLIVPPHEASRLEASSAGASGASPFIPLLFINGNSIFAYKPSARFQMME